MKIINTLFILAAVSFSQVALPAQPARQKVHKEFSETARCCCICGIIFMVTAMCSNHLLLGDASKMRGEIKGLQATPYGRMAIEHFKNQGRAEGYQKGLLACTTQSPLSPIMTRGDNNKKEKED